MQLSEGTTYSQAWSSGYCQTQQQCSTLCYTSVPLAACHAACTDVAALTMSLMVWNCVLSIQQRDLGGCRVGLGANQHTLLLLRSETWAVSKSLFNTPELSCLVCTLIYPKYLFVFLLYVKGGYLYRYLKKKRINCDIT